MINKIKIQFEHFYFLKFDILILLKKKKNWEWIIENENLSMNNFCDLYWKEIFAHFVNDRLIDQFKLSLRNK